MEGPVAFRNPFSRKTSVREGSDFAARAASDARELAEFALNDGVDADELPHAFGEFGLVPSNPIPTRTAFGIHSYVQRLTTGKGERVLGNRRGATASPVSRHSVDVYEIARPDGSVVATLYFSPYHRRNSGKAPAGFVLAPRVSL
jgi:hypothetical protein